MLSPKTELGDESSITLYVLTTEVVEKSSSFTDHQKEATPTVMVVLVLPKMLGEMVDTVGEYGHLHFGRTGVALVSAELGNYFCCGFHYALNL